MKIFILIEGENFPATVATDNHMNYCINESVDHNVAVKATIEEALKWCELSARQKQAKTPNSRLEQLYTNERKLRGYKVVQPTSSVFYCFEEYELDLSTPCEKAQATLFNPTKATDLQIAQAYDHVSTCEKCQNWCEDTLQVSGNFDLQQKINKIRGKAP